ncbi:hypothetical protein JCM10213v2_004028 [Rhodosporidiobolus nylandii]
MPSSSRPFGGVGLLPIAFALVCVLCFLPSARAFGAGNIPSYSFLEGKAFRHGDIEDKLAELIKKSGGILGRGSKFGGLDIKRVYFGNWLRDYSQAMDIAGLSKLSKQTILNLVMALGFLAHGYATGEFEVTDERLGVYLPTEHIDNPKGYAADQPGGDARRYDSRLRPPVNPQELEIDPRTGMKNYIANESGSWETSSKLVRERILQCIDLGRQARSGGGEKATYEAYRLLGTLLHTLEDFTAHSNWCELSLLRLGYHQVFSHVGDNVRIQSPAGPCPPLVTGSFGGSDFIHSLLGEATDHISEASVSDLQKAMDGARSTDRGIGGGSSTSDTLRKLLFDLPGTGGSQLSREMGDIEQIRTRAQQGGMNEMSPQELHRVLWQVLTFRDNVVKGIENTIERIGLASVVEKITNSVNAFVFETIEPMLKPIMGQATQVLGQGSAAVINNQDQFAVFNNPNDSDPTHSFLSKDHFALILNEPAGQIAVLILEHAVKLIVKAWEDNSIDPRGVAANILTAFHHPYFYDDSSEIQRQMGAYLKSWIDGQSAQDKRIILERLTKDAVRNHKNKRVGHESDQEGHGAHGSYNSVLMPQGVGAFAQQHIPGASSAMGAFTQAQNTFSSFTGSGGNQHSGPRRDFDGGNGSYGALGGPPQAVHGGAPSYNSDYNQPPPQQTYGQPHHQPHHQPSHSGYDAGYGAPPPSNRVGDVPHYGGGSTGGDFQPGYQSGPPGHFGGGGYGPPPGGDGYGGGFGGPQGGFGGPQGGFGGPPPPFQGQPHQSHGHHGGGQQGYPGQGYGSGGGGYGGGY